MAEITQKRLKELFYYSQGKLIEKTNRGRNKIGDELKSSKDKDGYLKCCVDFGYYRVHRLIFLYCFGYLPNIVDHIDRNILNNKIENLRAATPSQNSANRRKINNFVGVIKSRRTKGKFVAICAAKNKTKQLGTFSTKEEAARAYDKYVKEIHGDFAVTNF